ncbi:MAG: glycosyltransferase [Planctomycetota bacterium]|nr:glycosyltransferase [Planctomycetota bacterium]
MSATPPRVSICLPTWNGAAELEELLPRLAEQQLPGGLEIVAVDSSSTDGTAALLERFAARVERIAQSDFRHGATRNRIAELARGEILVFMTQDALPRDPTTIRSLVAAFDDGVTMGAYARVLPRADDDALTARTALAAHESSAVPLVFERATDGRKADESRLTFNNVTSAMRALAWRQLPFPDVSFGEDSTWAERALARGWRIRFAPEAVVMHAHRYTPRSAYERYKTDAAFRARELGQRVRPSLWSVAKGLTFEVREDWRFVRAEGRSRSAILRSPFLRGAQVLGQYVGSRATRA